MDAKEKSHESLEDKIGFLVDFYTKVLYENEEEKAGYFHLKTAIDLIVMYNEKNKNRNEFQKFIDDSIYFINALYTVAEDIAKGNPDNIHLIEREKIKELENRTLAKYNRKVYPMAYALMADKNDEKSIKKYLLAIDYTKSLEEGGPDMLLLDSESLEKIGEPYKKKGDFFQKKVRRRFFR